MEMCLDCKDRVVKIYHFRQKVSKVQKSQRKERVRPKSKADENPSKVVQSIFNIIEKYMEKCSVTAIRVNESSNSLIIESISQSGESNNEKEEGEHGNNVVIIKEEPLDIDSVVFSQFYSDSDNDSNNSTHAKRIPRLRAQKRAATNSKNVEITHDGEDYYHNDAKIRV
jgi:hypothetical protein